MSHYYFLGIRNCKHCSCCQSEVPEPEERVCKIWDRLETSASPGKQVRGGDEVTSESVPVKKRSIAVIWEDTTITPSVSSPHFLLPPTLYAEHKAV